MTEPEKKSGMIIRYNQTSDNPGAGISIVNCDVAEVYGNVAARNSGVGIQIVNTGPLLGLVELLRSHVGLQVTGPARDDALTIVKTIEDQAKSGKPSRAVLVPLLNALPQVAAIASTVKEILKLIG